MKKLMIALGGLALAVLALQLTGTVDVAEPAKEAASRVTDVAKPRPPARHARDPRDLVGDPERPVRVLYQYLDDKGQVRFVDRLDAVPPAWRDRAGRIEFEAPLEPGAPAARKRPGKPRRPRRGGQGGADLAVRPVSAAAPVIVYTTSWCGYCRQTLELLEKKGVAYENRDVEQNRRWARELVDLTGSTGVPVVVIEDEVIRGYDPRRLRRLLRRAG